MRYENVSTVEELNFRIMNYQSVGYDIEVRDNTHARLAKDDFSVGIFLVLLFFTIIGGIIYWAVKKGNEDIVIIQLDRTANNMQTNYSSVPNVPIEQNNAGIKCSSCDFINEEGSNFCFKCGNELSKDEKKRISLINECSKCGSMNEEGSKFCSECGAKLNMGVE